MSKILVSVKALLFAFFAIFSLFLATSAHAYEELPIVEVPIQEWASDAIQAPQVVPSTNVPTVPEVTVPEITVTVETPPSIQIDGSQTIVVEVEEESSDTNSKAVDKNNESSSNRPILQAPEITVTESAPTAESKPSKDKNKEKEKVVTPQRPVVQPYVPEAIEVPEIEYTSPESPDFGSAVLPDEGEVSQVEVENTSVPTPSPLWGMLGLGLLGAVGSATVLHFVRN